MKLSPESRRWLLRTIGTLLALVVGQNSGPFLIKVAIPRELFDHHMQVTENLRNPTANSEELAEKKMVLRGHNPYSKGELLYELEKTLIPYQCC